MAAALMDPSGTALAGLSSCLLSLWVWKKHGRGKPIPQATPSTGENNPRTTHRATGNQKRAPEKGKEGCRALPNGQGMMGCNRLHGWSQPWSLLGQPQAVPRSHLTTAQGHHSLQGASSATHAYTLIPCRNPSDEIQHSPTKHHGCVGLLREGSVLLLPN